jgi:DNA-binding transcriptional MerR regulator/methylmalonyl-CoA mutase cobalamin-binding subunit
MHTIKKAAELTGVPEHTLRAWERRYRLVEPARTDAGYRLYDDRAIARIRAMRDLVEAGWSARAAAEESGRREPATLPGAASRDALIAAAADLDGEAIARVLDEEFARGSFESVVDEWLMPTLSQLGRGWERGEVSVAGEHLASSVVMRRLATAYEAAGRSATGPTVVVGAPPGVDHELGLLAFATAARRAGLDTVYLGAQVPADAWRVATAKVGAAHAVSSLHQRKDAARLGPVSDALAGLPGLTLWVGGRHQGLAPEPWQPLGHSIAAAAARLTGR